MQCGALAVGDKGGCCVCQAGNRVMFVRQVSLCWGCAEQCGQSPQTTMRYHCQGGKIQAEMHVLALFILRGHVSDRDVPSSSVPRDTE